MFESMGLDLTKLSDDDLLERLNTINKRIVQCSRFGSADAINQLRSLMNAITQERRERAFAPVGKAWGAAAPVGIETDPELASAQAAAQEASKALPTATTRRVPVTKRVVRSDKPTGS